jgi:hypothetical protein
VWIKIRLRPLIFNSLLLSKLFPKKSVKPKIRYLSPYACVLQWHLELWYLYIVLSLCIILHRICVCDLRSVYVSCSEFMYKTMYLNCGGTTKCGICLGKYDDRVFWRLDKLCLIIISSFTKSLTFIIYFQFYSRTFNIFIFDSFYYLFNWLTWLKEWKKKEFKNDRCSC